MMRSGNPRAKAATCSSPYATTSSWNAANSAACAKESLSMPARIASAKASVTKPRASRRVSAESGSSMEVRIGSFITGETLTSALWPCDCRLSKGLTRSEKQPRYIQICSNWALSHGLGGGRMLAAAVLARDVVRQSSALVEEALHRGLRVGRARAVGDLIAPKTAVEGAGQPFATRLCWRFGFDQGVHARLPG